MIKKSAHPTMTVIRRPGRAAAKAAPAESPSEAQPAPSPPPAARPASPASPAQDRAPRPHAARLERDRAPGQGAPRPSPRRAPQPAGAPRPGGRPSSPTNGRPPRAAAPEREDGALTLENFRDDEQFPRIEAAVAEILATGKVVAPVDVLVKMGLLEPDDLASWRAGGVPYLESVVRSKFGGLGRLLRILRFHVHDLKLMAQSAEYTLAYDGSVVKLRFTKSGVAKVEEAYSRHFVWPGKGPFRMPKK